MAPDGQGLTYVEQEPAPAGAARPRQRGRCGRRRTISRLPADAAARGGNAPQRKDRVYQWLPPFDSASAKVIYENPTPHDRPSLFTRHAVALLHGDAPARTRSSPPST